MRTSNNGNLLLISTAENQGMQEREAGCEHRWRYFVNTASRAVRLRKCERCDLRDIVASRPTSLLPEALVEKLTA